MKINTEKCKVTLTSDSVSNVTIENENIEIVKEFNFLWSLVPNSSDNAKRRIALANSAFGRLKKIVWSRRDVSVNLNLRLYMGSETWYLRQLDTKKLNVFENNCLRAILTTRLQGHVSINEIQKSAKQRNSIEKKTRKRRLAWFGHVFRLNDEILQKRMMKEEFN